MQTLETIFNNFPITNDEYARLEQKFGNLVHYAAWQLKKKNINNTSCNDHDDDVQRLRLASMRAACYFKRQTYIESCLEILDDYVTDKFSLRLAKELQRLWGDRRHHGAHRQKFGEFHEQILEKLVTAYVPENVRPSRSQPLVINAEFARYCKQIVWNEQRALGKEITREKFWRNGLVSLNDFSYLAED